MNQMHITRRASGGLPAVHGFGENAHRASSRRRTQRSLARLSVFRDGAEAGGNADHRAIAELDVVLAQGEAALSM